MTQLILDTGGLNVALPESRHENYFAALTPLSDEVEMISGRLVRELRGEVWQISYQYGYFREAMKNRVLAACRKGRREPINCAFLPPESVGELRQGRFWVLSFDEPKFFWSRPAGGRREPLWGGFALTLREVKPGD